MALLAKFFLALCTLASVAVSSAIKARDVNERVLLVNCDNGQSSSRLFWYPGVSTTGTPGGQAIVRMPIGSFLWESGNVSGTFADGNVFTSTIRYNCPAGAYAGPATNSYGIAFYCYRRNNPNLNYRTADGSHCWTVYECTRQKPSNTNVASQTGCVLVGGSATTVPAPGPVPTRPPTSGGQMTQGSRSTGGVFKTVGG